MLDRKKLQSLAIGAAVVVVAGFFVAVATIGPSRIGAFLADLMGGSTPSIEVATNGGIGDDYFAGQVLYFRLDDVPATDVIWVFNNRIARLGGQETQHAFERDSSDTAGRSFTRRVDAFFFDGGEWSPAEPRHIEVINREPFAFLVSADSTITYRLADPLGAIPTLYELRDGEFARSSIADSLSRSGTVVEVPAHVARLRDLWLGLPGSAGYPDRVAEIGGDRVRFER